jgi:hypothetical protein
MNYLRTPDFIDAFLFNNLNVTNCATSSFLTFTFWSAAFLEICAIANYSKPCHKTSSQGSRVCHGLSSSRDQLSQGRRRDRDRDRRERSRGQGRRRGIGGGIGGEE